MAGDEEVEAVEPIEAVDESGEATDAEEVEGFGMDIGGMGGIRRPIVNSGPVGPKTPEGTGPIGPGGSTPGTGKPSADFEPNNVHF